MELEKEYERELGALKRLIEYRSSREEQKRMEEVRKESERQMEDLLVSYQSMQLEMMRVREEVLTCHQKDLTGWETIIAEREVLLEKVQLWESRYEELRCLFEAKLSSKEETINLLTLKIGNLEMGPRKICHCI